MKAKQILLALVGSAAIISTATTYAFPGQRGHSYNSGLTQNLGLTAAQKMEIKAALKEEREKQKSLDKSMAEARAKLAKLATAPNYDSAAVKVQAEKMGDLVVQLVELKTHSQYTMYSLLTDEQKAKFKAMRETAQTHKNTPKNIMPQ